MSDDSKTSEREWGKGSQPAWRDRTTGERQVSLRERVASLRNIRPLLKMLWQTSHLLMIATAGLRICRAGLPLLALWIPKLIVDSIVLQVSQGIRNHTRIWLLVGAELTVAIANEVLTRFNTLCDSLLADQFTNRLRMNIIRHASTLDLASFEDPLFYDSLERARSQSAGRMELIAALLNLMQNVLSIVVLSAGLALFSPWLLILLAVGFLPPFLGESRFTTLTYSSLFRWTPYRRLLDYLCYLGASPDSAKEIKLFGLGNHLAKAYVSVSSEIYEDHKGIAVKRATVGALLNVISTVTYYGAYVIILMNTLAGQLSLGSFVFLTGSFTRSRFYIDRVMAEITEISGQALYLRDLFTFFDAQPSIRSVPKARLVPRPLRHGFEFRNVSFAYPGSDHSVLHDISFHLPPGETLALVGENGAGKTTLIKLLLRLYDPTSGEVLLDGVDLRNYELADLHRNVGVLFQDYVRYDMLVRDNIGFGDVRSLGDHIRITEAARRGGAYELIDRLPKQYEQLLGRRFEGGIALSGGEWQKLALARAFMRDALLMILDEPTATLDARAEFELFQRFTELARARMLVLISHRFSTVRMADQIVVLSSGTIRERGKHGDLIRLGQHYAELFELQAAAYR